MHRQLLATAVAYLLAVSSLVASIAWLITGQELWAWPAAAAGIGAVTLVAWLVTQPLPHERREARD